MVLNSVDGSEWIRATSGTSWPLLGLAWTGTMLVAVGKNTYLTSTDGILWNGSIDKTTYILNSVTWNGRYAVAAGNLGTILTSPDGAIWTGRTSMTTDTLRAITASDRQVVAVGDSGTVSTSADAKTWKSSRTLLKNNLYGLTWTGASLASGINEFVAVGAGGLIMSSIHDEVSVGPPEFAKTSLTGRAAPGLAETVDVAGRVHRNSRRAAGILVSAGKNERHQVSVQFPRQHDMRINKGNCR